MSKKLTAPLPKNMISNCKKSIIGAPVSEQKNKNIKVK